MFAATAEPVEGEGEPCVWCNHPQTVAERKYAMADGSNTDPDDISDSAAMCRGDYTFTVGHPEGEGVEIPVCEGCLYDLPVEFGDSDIRDLQYRWQEEVVLQTAVPRLDADEGHVHRGVPVTALGDTTTDLSGDD